jgi:pyridoxine/pyridoxamine 5'-phosphate oxidase
MDATDLDADPLRQLATWLDAARAAGQPMPEAMTIASATIDAVPSARLVILRGLQRGLVFFTDGESDKATELVANPRAAAVLPSRVEFWQESPDGLHDRIRYRREGGGWMIERLSP